MLLRLLLLLLPLLLLLGTFKVVGFASLSTSTLVLAAGLLVGHAGFGIYARCTGYFLLLFLKSCNGEWLAGSFGRRELVV